jgi:uncharacterized membrane protein
MKTIILGLMLLPNVSAATTTYKDVQPIFKNRCSQCHDYLEGRNWQKYDDAFKKRQQIKERMVNKSMPMGQDMPQAERDLIIKWVDQGAKN